MKNWLRASFYIWICLHIIVGLAYLVSIWTGMQRDPINPVLFILAGICLSLFLGAIVSRGTK